MINKVNLPNYIYEKNMKDGSISIICNDKNVCNVPTAYRFNKDGSASCSFLGYKGTTLTCPKDTFSDLMLKLDKTKELNDKIAKQMATAYNKIDNSNIVVYSKDGCRKWHN